MPCKPASSRAGAQAPWLSKEVPGSCMWSALPHPLANPVYGADAQALPVLSEPLKDHCAGGPHRSRPCTADSAMTDTTQLLQNMRELAKELEGMADQCAGVWNLPEEDGGARHQTVVAHEGSHCSNIETTMGWCCGIATTARGPPATGQSAASTAQPYVLHVQSSGNCGASHQNYVLRGVASPGDLSGAGPYMVTTPGCRLARGPSRELTCSLVYPVTAPMSAHQRPCTGEPLTRVTRGQGSQFLTNAGDLPPGPCIPRSPPAMPRSTADVWRGPHGWTDARAPDEDTAPIFPRGKCQCPSMDDAVAAPAVLSSPGDLSRPCPPVEEKQPHAQELPGGLLPVSFQPRQVLGEVNHRGPVVLGEKRLTNKPLKIYDIRTTTRPMGHSSGPAYKAASASRVENHPWGGEAITRPRGSQTTHEGRQQKGTFVFKEYGIQRCPASTVKGRPGSRGLSLMDKTSSEQLPSTRKHRTQQSGQSAAWRV